MKTRLIIWYMATSTKGQQLGGYIDTTVEEDPSGPTKQSTLNELFQGLKTQMCANGFIAQAIVPTNIFRIAADVDSPQIEVPAVPNLMPSREIAPRGSRR